MTQPVSLNWIPVGLTILAIFLFFRSRRRSLSYLRGPPRNSKLFGRELDLLFQQDVGDLEFKWVEEYGTAFPVPNCYGQDTLFICDPRALQYVLHTSEYKYPRPADLKFLLKGFLGSGIIYSEDATHQRQRKILNPAFSGEHLRQFLTDFQAHTNRLVRHIDDQLTHGKDTIDMAKLLPKITLDIIGDTGFRYRFGALEDEITELSHKFLHLFDDSKRITKYQLLSNALRRYLPPFVSEMTRLAPTKEELRFADFHQASSKLAEAIINQKGRDLVDPARGTDILDILREQMFPAAIESGVGVNFNITVTDRSNNSEDPNKRMSDHEVFSQLASRNHGVYDWMAALRTVLPQIWGKDANEWNPSRFLDIDSREQTAVGPFFNLGTFSAGPKSCLGFRFGVTEVRAIIVGLLEAFEFFLPEGGLELQKLPGGGILHPMVRGKLHEGPSLPLVVKPRQAVM
ncbi:hypothetical protein CVT24_003123 [Panaeolus cyanescens]|uniref:Cytochrome P450 n=1 Tax=Panaeolus cyanescens TaxID=181874 RepID=A0A409WT42_9AGAR|nr:hypothetical protein CVT24_003123 [Panaeolus cyanescens]